MKTLNRLLLIILCVALVAATYGMYLNTTQEVHNHTVRYLIKWPYLHEIRQWSLFAVLVWCLVFAKSQPTFVRLGLAAVIVTLVIMLVPLRSL